MKPIHPRVRFLVVRVLHPSFKDLDLEDQDLCWVLLGILAWVAIQVQVAMVMAIPIADIADTVLEAISAHIHK